MLVTSGAIGVGAGHLGLKERPRDIGGKQAAAARRPVRADVYIRQAVFRVWPRHRPGAAHRDVVEDDRRKSNVVNTHCRLLEYGAVPIINENDTVATEEIEFGDNDTLSALVAELVGADALVLLTDIDGLYDADPHQSPDAHPIPEVRIIDQNLLKLAGGAGSNRGTGGMVTKLHAAEIAMAAGIPAVIMNGARPPACTT